MSGLNFAGVGGAMSPGGGVAGPAGGANLIGGQLPFGGGQGGMMAAAGPGGNLGAAYASSYADALNQNATMYGNIMNGYQQTSQNMQNNQQSILQRYDNLGGQVMNTIRGVGQSQQQAINDAFAQQSGGLQQSLINSGLGNSTVMGSMARGVNLDQQKASVALANQLAQLSAGYQSQLGSQAAGYANQSNMQLAGQNNQQLGFMNSVQMGYPNAQSYQQLLQNQGALAQQQQFMQQYGASMFARPGAPATAAGMPAIPPTPYTPNAAFGQQLAGGNVGGGYNGGYAQPYMASAASAYGQPQTINTGVPAFGGGAAMGGALGPYASAYDPTGLYAGSGAGADSTGGYDASVSMS